MTINDNIKSKLPYLNLDNPNDLEVIETTKIEVFVILEEFLNKPNDTTYTDKEKILATYYVCYLLVQNKVIETLAGNVNVGSGVEPANVFIKKQKADVVEEEYDLIKASDGANLSLKTDTLLANFQKMACKLAYTMGFHLPICIDEIEVIDILPIKYYGD